MKVYYVSKNRESEREKRRKKIISSKLGWRDRKERDRYSQIERVRERQREIVRQRDRETEREREKEGEIKKDRERQRQKERDRKRGVERGKRSKKNDLGFDENSWEG